MQFTSFSGTHMTRANFKMRRGGEKKGMAGMGVSTN
jgi:hypothetical protein